MTSHRPSIDESLAACDTALEPSGAARTEAPFKWWQSVLALLCFCAVGYGVYAGWQFYCVSQSLGKLKSPDAGIRLAAATELGRLKSARSVNTLIAALYDSDRTVQQAAAAALGEIKDPRAVQPLLTAMRTAGKDTPEVAQAAAEALGNYGPQNLELLITAVKDKNLAEYGISGLVKMGAPAIDTLVADLRYPDPDVRWQAANALGDIKDARAVQPLIDLLPNKELQLHAAHSLGEIKDPRAVAPLIAALNSQDPELRAQAAESLGKIKDPRADQSLVAALKDPEEKVQLSAANALGQIGDPQAVSVLLTAFRAHDATVIAGAGTFFIQRGESGSEDVLIDALHRSGSKELAEDMLNCGNTKLHNAANEWAGTHNYEINYMPGAKAASWGAKP